MVGRKLADIFDNAGRNVGGIFEATGPGLSEGLAGCLGCGLVIGLVGIGTAASIGAFFVTFGLLLVVIPLGAMVLAMGLAAEDFLPAGALLALFSGLAIATIFVLLDGYFSEMDKVLLTSFGNGILLIFWGEVAVCAVIRLLRKYLGVGLSGFRDWFNDEPRGTQPAVQELRLTLLSAFYLANTYGNDLLHGEIIPPTTVDFQRKVQELRQQVMLDTGLDLEDAGKILSPEAAALWREVDRNPPLLSPEAVALWKEAYSLYTKACLERSSTR